MDARQWEREIHLNNLKKKIMKTTKISEEYQQLNNIVSIWFGSKSMQNAYYHLEKFKLKI